MRQKERVKEKRRKGTRGRGSRGKLKKGETKHSTVEGVLFQLPNTHVLLLATLQGAHQNQNDQDLFIDHLPKMVVHPQGQGSKQ